jgi:hypothetical protein
MIQVGHDFFSSIFKVSVTQNEGFLIYSALQRIHDNRVPWRRQHRASWKSVMCTEAYSRWGIKANSHIACRAHAVPLPCRAAKSLECVFPIWFTLCGRVWFTLAMPRPCPAPTMPFFSRPLHRTAVERRPVGDRPTFGFFRQPRGVPRRLLSEAYHSQMQVASVKPNNVCHGRGKEW